MASVLILSATRLNCLINFPNSHFTCIDPAINRPLTPYSAIGCILCLSDIERELKEKIRWATKHCDAQKPKMPE